MNEINDLAGQHEVVAENLQANVIKELNALVKDIREERKVSMEKDQVGVLIRKYMLSLQLQIINVFGKVEVNGVVYKVR
jgi:hypothetical protein